MRMNGWQTPYHPFQLLAMTFFTVLGLLFYSFFLPFLGGKRAQRVALLLYTPLIISVVTLYIWCTATNPRDPGIRRSTDQSNLEAAEEHVLCTLCEAEVLTNSKHCQKCDKCVDGFDHHCKWINNCIGKRNYIGFFILISSALLLLVVQWLSGIFVIMLCIVKRGEFFRQIDSKLEISFSTVAFIIIVATCTIVAMAATLPLVKLLCFHIFLIKKGITTYDYIVASRDQEEVSGHQSPRMSVSSIAGFSTASSFGPLHRGSWCTPPRVFLEDHVVVPRAAHIESTSSTSDGYEGSASEDSDRIPSRIVYRSSNWANSSRFWPGSPSA